MKTEQCAHVSQICPYFSSLSAVLHPKSGKRLRGGTSVDGGRQRERKRERESQITHSLHLHAQAHIINCPPPQVCQGLCPLRRPASGLTSLSAVRPSPQVARAAGQFFPARSNRGQGRLAVLDLHPG